MLNVTLYFLERVGSTSLGGGGGVGGMEREVERLFLDERVGVEIYWSLAPVLVVVSIIWELGFSWNYFTCFVCLF